MDDSEAMRRAVGAGRHRPGHHLAQPVGRLCPVAADGRCSRERPNRPVVPTPRRSPWRPPVTPPAGPPCSPPSNRARTTAARRRAPTRSIDAGVAGSWSASRIPTPHVAGQGIARLRAAGIEVDARRGGRARCAAQLAPVPEAPHDGPAVGRAEAGVDASTGAPPRPTARASGSPARRHGPTPIGCGPRATPSSSAPAPCGPTIPALTVRHVDGRDPLRVVLGRAPAGAQGAAGARVPGELGELLDELGRRGVCRRMVEGGATVAGAFHRAGLVDRYVLVSRAGAVRRRRRPRPVRRPGRADRSTTCGGAASSRSTSSATTCASTSSRSRRHGRQLTCSPASSRSSAPSSPVRVARLRINAHTVLDGRRARRLDRRQRLLPHGGRLGRGDWWEADVVRRDLRSHQPRHRCGPAIRSNLERPVRLADRLGGHLVQGHVDAVGEIVDPAPDLRVRMPAELLRYIVEKGSDHRRRCQPHRRRGPGRRLHGRRHPAHHGGHDPRLESSRDRRSISRSTSSPSTSNRCWKDTGHDDRPDHRRRR